MKTNAELLRAVQYFTREKDIMSGLLLDTAEFRQEKEEIVKELMNKLAKLARGEADWLFAMHNATGKYLTDLTEELSTTINSKNAEIVEYFAQHPEKMQNKVILAHLPKTLATKYADRISRLPEEYKPVIASVELATRIVYTQTGSLPAEVDCATAAI